MKSLQLASVLAAVRTGSSLEAESIVTSGPCPSVADGLFPPSSFRLVNHDGQLVSFVVQDRTNGFELKPELDEKISAPISKEIARSLIVDGLTVEFDSEVMRERAPGGLRVEEIVAAELGRLRAEFETCGLLTADEAHRVIRFCQTRTLAPGLLGRLPAVAAGRVDRLKDSMSLLSSVVVQFIQA
jgi:hypothetical protein